MSETILYPIYYYIPQINPDSITNAQVTTDGLYSVAITGSFPFIFGTFPLTFVSDIEAVTGMTFYATPNAYIQWYNLNSSAIANASQSYTLQSVYNQCVNDSLESKQAAAISSNGLLLIPWSQEVSGVTDAEIPLKWSYTNEYDYQCYAIVDPTGQWPGSWIIGSNILSGSNPPGGTNATNPTGNATPALPAAVWVVIIGVLLVIALIIIQRSTAGRGLGITSRIDKGVSIAKKARSKSDNKSSSAPAFDTLNLKS